MKTARWSWVCCIVAAFAMMYMIQQGRNDAARQTSALANARRQNLELHGLETENEHWEAAQLTGEEARRLQQRHSEAEALRSRLLELKRRAREKQPGDEAANTAHASIPATDWAYVGRATPEAAIQSVVWAASHGDVDRLASLLTFGPDERAQAEAMFSQLPPEAQANYGSAQKVVATLLAGNFPKDAVAVTIVESHQWDMDAAVSMDVGHTAGATAMRNNTFRFRRGDDGWQHLVPSTVLAGYVKMLQGDPLSGGTAGP